MPDTIQALVEKFVAQIEAAIREEALATVRAALEAGTEPSPKAAKAPVKPSQPAKAPNGGQKRRSAKEIEADAGRLLIAIRAKPGTTSEELKRAAKIMPRDFGLPIAKLLGEKRIKKTGEKRSTKYFPA
jgi:hypothetical protein